MSPSYGIKGVLSLDKLSALVRAHRLYPSGADLQVVKGSDVANILHLETKKEIQQRLDDLVVRMREPDNRKDALLEAMGLVQSEHEQDLFYAAQMFMHERLVIRNLAKNPNLSERTQLILATHPMLKQDKQIQRNLAHNPNLTPATMSKMLDNQGDLFVLHAIALNAARRAVAHDELEDICQKLAEYPFDNAVAIAAIPGVKNPEILRHIADNTSAVFAADKVAAIATNPNTPDDVLERLANSSAGVFAHYFGVDVANRARHTMSAKGLGQNQSNAPRFTQ